MKVKQTILVVGIMLASLTGMVGGAPRVSALECGQGVQTSIIGGDICKGVDNKSNDVKANAIWKLLIWVLNIMLAGVGILAVAGVVWASVLYVTAADSAEQIKKAKEMIRNVVIGIIAYGLMYSALNFLIPGGIFT